MVGPIFKLIELQVFQHPAFIKHVPVCDRPEYIYERLYAEGGKYVTTDYTSFESLFTRSLMMACEMRLYMYMTRNLPDREFARMCEDVLAGRNHCAFKGFSVSVDATRMSGEMCTSLGNGFSNLMFMLFLCKRVGSTHVVGVVEGDDGLNRVEGPCPTIADFADLGLVIKLEVFDKIEDASFCGLVFDSIERINVTNPIEALLKFGWTTRDYSLVNQKTLNTLLRASSMSMKYQFDGCPVLWALADYGIRVTTQINMQRFLRRKMSWWYREMLAAAFARQHLPSRRPGLRTRLLVEDRYGISVDAQLRMEAYLNSLMAVEPLEFDQFGDYVHVDHVHYYETYVVEIPVEEIGRFPPIWYPRGAQNPEVISN
jgi:hypothetical protein